MTPAPGASLRLRRRRETTNESIAIVAIAPTSNAAKADGHRVATEAAVADT
jgi:hypothetical protein